MKKKQNPNDPYIMFERDIKLILKVSNDALKDPQNYQKYIFSIMNKCINILPL